MPVRFVPMNRNELAATRPAVAHLACSRLTFFHTGVPTVVAESARLAIPTWL